MQVNIGVLAVQANEEEDLEVEAATTEIQMLQEQIQLGRRVDSLRDMRSKALQLAARVAAEVAEAKAEQKVQNGSAGADAADDPEESDEEDEGDGGLSALNWRARAL